MYCYVSYFTCVELHYLHYHKGIVQANEDNIPTSIVESNIQRVAHRTGKSFFFGIEIPQLFPVICFNNDIACTVMYHVLHV